MNSPQPIANLSLDLDNQWSYLKIHGDPGWEEFPSYLDQLVPRVLDCLEKQGLKITFFIVGQDAALEKNHTALRMISAAGHDIGNHSFSHEPWFHLYDRARMESEIVRAEKPLTLIAGKRPVGFRGPGFSFSNTTAEVLEARGYLYDASNFPTFLGPLARLYYLFHSRLTSGQRRERDKLFGGFKDGLRPIRPYRLPSTKGLLEIPVTTMPLVRTPIHFSYLQYLGTYSTSLALGYFRAALGLCRLFGISPSLLLHPLDFLGSDDGVGLRFFPAMKISGKQKRKFLSEALRILCDEFKVISVGDFAARILGQANASAAVACPPPIRLAAE